MDESQLETHKSQVKWKIFPVVDWSNAEEVKAAEKAAKDFKAEHKNWSDVGHSDKGYYVGYCRAGELAMESVSEASKWYKLNVELTAGYMLGTTWASCH